VERIDSYSDLGSQGVTCILKGSSQNVFSHPELPLEIGVGVDSWRINDHNLDFMMNEIV